MGLVLGRKVGQSIIINSNIVITITGRSGNYIYLHIEAPDVITINREEVEYRKENENDQD